MIMWQKLENKGEQSLSRLIDLCWTEFSPNVAHIYSKKNCDKQVWKIYFKAAFHIFFRNVNNIWGRNMLGFIAGLPEGIMFTENWMNAHSDYCVNKTDDKNLTEANLHVYAISRFPPAHYVYFSRSIMYVLRGNQNLITSVGKAEHRFKLYIMNKTVNIGWMLLFKTLWVFLPSSCWNKTFHRETSFTFQEGADEHLAVCKKRVWRSQCEAFKAPWKVIRIVVDGAGSIMLWASSMPENAGQH